jgi:hypothetical protein
MATARQRDVISKNIEKKRQDEEDIERRCLAIRDRRWSRLHVCVERGCNAFELIIGGNRYG